MIVNMISRGANSNQSTGTTRRDQIVDAATPVFLRFGYKKSSMEAVAAAGGISRQALYLHFPNKESMFSAVVDGLGQLTGRVAHIALWRPGLTLDQQLLAVFDETMPRESPELLAELLATAKESFQTRSQISTPKWSPRSVLGSISLWSIWSGRCPAYRSKKRPKFFKQRRTVSSSRAAIALTT